VVATGDRYVAQANQLTWDWTIAVMLATVFVSLVFLTQLLVAIVNIKRLISSNPTKKWNDIQFVFTNAKGTPFSFFKYIFWNEQIDLNSCEGEQILKHELTHVQENHSVDKIFISILLIVSWYNPFMWLIRKELNMIHEFIADKKAIGNGDTSAFAQMLLKTAFPAQSGMLTNSFFHSPIKRRLIMLTTNLNPRYSYLRRLMILPLLTVVLLLFAFGYKEKGVNWRHKQSAAASFSNPENETPAQFPGGMVSWRRYLERNLNLNILKENKAPVGKYAAVIVFTVNADGSISNVIAETKTGYGTEEEAISLIKKGPKWEPAKKDGLLIESKVRQAVNFVMTDAGALVYIDPLDLIKAKQPSKNSIDANFQDTTKKKGRETKVVNVTFRDSAGNESTIPAAVTITSRDPEKKTLVVLNGKEMTWEEFEKHGLQPDQVQEINVLKDASTKNKYGEKGKYGVIEITTKHEGEVKEVRPAYSKVFTVVENPPYYPNGMAAFAEYINTNIQYPKEALQKKVQGAVLIQFIVNEEGKLTDFKKLSSKGQGLEEEAIRLLINSGEWKPGVQNGHKVPVQVQQQVTFELPQKS
ncbi:TonB family protein, partial [Segetibacter sp.]|uniref:TonB family protein n=1 Tax=Segetibacter sp. TaxID=2231182 RepID=UPI0026336B59